MNRPTRIPKSNAKKRVHSSNSNSEYGKRRGLSSAEEIVTLILKRYGLDESDVEDAGETAVESEIVVESETVAIGPVNTTVFDVTPDATAAQQMTFVWQ